jgi:hypothetical protein
LKTLETVETETPLSRATSRMPVCASVPKTFSAP